MPAPHGSSAHAEPQTNCRGGSESGRRDFSGQLRAPDLRRIPSSSGTIPNGRFLVGGYRRGTARRRQPSAVRRNAADGTSPQSGTVRRSPHMPPGAGGIKTEKPRQRTVTPRAIKRAPAQRPVRACRTNAFRQHLRPASDELCAAKRRGPRRMRTNKKTIYLIIFCPKNLQSIKKTLTLHPEIIGISSAVRRAASAPRVRPGIRKRRTTGCSAVRLAHLLWEQGVVGSNPATPTRRKNIVRGVAQSG